jgi:hypothetical protein
MKSSWQMCVSCERYRTAIVRHDCVPTLAPTRPSDNWQHRLFYRTPTAPSSHTTPLLVGSTVCFTSEDVIWDLWYRARGIDKSMLALPAQWEVSPRIGLIQVPRCTAARRRKPKCASQKEACLFCANSGCRGTQCDPIATALSRSRQEPSPSGRTGSCRRAIHTPCQSRQCWDRSSWPTRALPHRRHICSTKVGPGPHISQSRRRRSQTWACWIARQSRKMFRAKPMPELMSPVWEPRIKAMPQLINLTMQPRSVSGFDLEWPCGPKA